MIEKISSSDYLKRSDNMTISEKEVLMSRIGEWLPTHGRLLMDQLGDVYSSMQNVVQLSAGWNDDLCKSFMDGVIILSSFSYNKDTWLPDTLYRVSAKRSIKRMVDILSREYAMYHGDEKYKVVSSVASVESGEDSPKEEDRSSSAKKGESKHEVRVDTPVRPKHIDQYIHLLPESTQEKASQYGSLMRELDTARENLRLLMNDEQSQDKDRERLAKLATKYDAQLKSIRIELDREWEKLVESGKVRVDDLGNAYVVK